MKPLFLALILLAGFANAICINAGGPATSDCGADQYFSGGVTWGPADQIGIPLATLRYASAFSYQIPVEPGAYQVDLSFVEPNKTAAGQRIFAVTVNGQTSAALDVFAIAGGALKITVKNYFAVASVGYIRLDFKAMVGNAMVSRIEISKSPVVQTTATQSTIVQSITLNPVLDGSTYRPQVRGETLLFVSPGAFTIAHAPVDGSLAIYANGLRLKEFTDYSRDGVAITFVAQLTAADVVQADYFYDMPVQSIP